jgi:hypothetical protein
MAFEIRAQILHEGLGLKRFTGWNLRVPELYVSNTCNRVRLKAASAGKILGLATVMTSAL